MNPKIQAIVERAVIEIAHEMEMSPMLASLELLQGALRAFPISGESLLAFCCEVIKEKDQEAAS